MFARWFALFYPWLRRLLTIPKSVGYAQNPLSIYYCYDSAGQGQDGELRMCIAEVKSVSMIHLDWVMINYLHCHNLSIFVSGHKHSLGREGDVYLPTGLWSCCEALACQPLYGMTSLKNHFASKKNVPCVLRFQKMWYLEPFYGKTDIIDLLKSNFAWLSSLAWGSSLQILWCGRIINVSDSEICVLCSPLLHILIGFLFVGMSCRICSATGVFMLMPLGIAYMLSYQFSIQHLGTISLQLCMPN